MKYLFVMPVFFVLSACEYKCAFQDREETALSIEVPYIQGDMDAQLNSSLIYELTASGRFSPVQKGGDLLLKVSFVSNAQDRIGFRYDRDNPSGKREKNLLGVEGRHTGEVEVLVIDNRTNKVLIGPCIVSSYIDYDYTDPGSPRDLLFADKEPVIQFSLGQLDSSDSAFDDSTKPLSHKLSQKIVQGLLNTLVETGASS